MQFAPPLSDYEGYMIDLLRIWEKEPLIPLAVQDAVGLAEVRLDGDGGERPGAAQSRA